MPHFAFDILRQLAHPDASAASLEARQAFKSQVWYLPVWIPGTQTDVADNKTRNDLVLVAGDEGAPPIMELFFDEADAKAEYSAGYFAATFRYAIMYAELARIDVVISEGEEGLLLTHDQLLGMRDMAAMGGEGVPMDEDEVASYKIATRDFAVMARQYCTQHSDIESLHLAVLMTSGVKPLLTGTLKAQRMALHAEALAEMSRDVLLPAWRFSLYDDGPGHAAGIVAELKQLAPCFHKASDTGWWNKIKHGFKDPLIGIIQMEVDAERGILSPK